MRLYTVIARALGAAQRCEIPGASCAEWGPKHRDRIDRLVRDHCPHGSGFDAGTSFDHDRSRPNRLVFRAEFHHMDEGGFYDGWSEHDVIVTPSLEFGINVRVTGSDRNDIKEYVAEIFGDALDSDVSEY